MREHRRHGLVRLRPAAGVDLRLRGATLTLVFLFLQNNIARTCLFYRNKFIFSSAIAFSSFGKQAAEPETQN